LAHDGDHVHDVRGLLHLPERYTLVLHEVWSEMQVSALASHLHAHKSGPKVCCGVSTDVARRGVVLVWHDEGKGVALSAHSSASADSVDKRVRVLRRVVPTDKRRRC
jgi:hypothetical protein